MRSLAPLLAIVLLVHGCAPSPFERSFPDRLGDLSVLTVTEAIEARNRGERGPFALAGWWSHEGIDHSCPAGIRPPAPLELACHVGHWGLTERQEPMVEVRRSTNAGAAMTEMRAGIAQGPWIQPFIEFDEPIASRSGDATVPVPVVLIGHFDDPRTAACAEDQRLGCRQRFVATDLGWTPGQP